MGKNMAKFTCAQFFLLAIFASYSHSASLSDGHEREKSPIESNPDYSASGLRIHGGDMLYPEDLITDEMRQAVTGDKYNIGDPNCLRWPGGVMLYHRNQTTMGDSAFRMLQKAMDIWEKLSCVSFRAVGRDSKDAFVKFTDTSTGCYAHVGRICWIPGYNELNLGSGCYWDVGTPAHELAHAFGIYHQQSRSDRDKYVKIIEANIIKGKEHNFNKKTPQEASNHGVDYDYCSVMHYGNDFFGIRDQNNRPKLTIVHVDPSNNMYFGQRQGPSFGDIKLMNTVYKCAAGCPKIETCTPPCFMNKGCMCYCPDKTTSPSCKGYTESHLPIEVPPTMTQTTPKMTTTTTTTTRKPTTPKPVSCDQTVDLTKKNKGLSFTDMNKEEKFCTIKIQTTKYKKITLRINKGKFFPKSCVGNYFQVNTQGSTQFNGLQKNCGNIKKKQALTFNSDGNIMHLRIRLSGVPKHKNAVLKAKITGKP